MCPLYAPFSLTTRNMINYARAPDKSYSNKQVKNYQFFEDKILLEHAYQSNESDICYSTTQPSSDIVKIIYYTIKIASNTVLCKLKKTDIKQILI